MEKINDEVKRQVLENLSNTPIKFFRSMDSMRCELALIAISIDLKDITTEMWGAVKMCYCALTNGNTKLNETSIIICDKIIKNSFISGTSARGKILEPAN